MGRVLESEAGRRKAARGRPAFHELGPHLARPQGDGEMGLLA